MKIVKAKFEIYEAQKKRVWAKVHRAGKNSKHEKEADCVDMMERNRRRFQYGLELNE